MEKPILETFEILINAIEKIIETLSNVIRTLI